MAETLRVYEFGAVTPVATLTPKRGTGKWRHRAGEDGSAKVTGFNVPAAALAENTYVRIHNGTKDVFAFLNTDPVRRALDSNGTTEVDFSGPGIRALLHAGQVYQEDTTDCAEPADMRWWGWMSGYYDDSAWARALSFGQYVSGPFETPRPENWVAPFAELITIDTNAVTGRDWGARKTFTLSEEAEFILAVAADDEYRVWVDDREVLSTIGGGPFQWQRFQQEPLKLCAGTHTIAIQVRNLDRPAALQATNYTWLIVSLAPVNSAGKTRNANQIWHVWHDHTGGSFTLSTWFDAVTGPIDWDATDVEVQVALEAVVGAGNVTVDGTGHVENQVYELSHDHTGGTFTIEGEGGLDTDPIAYNASAATVQAALEALTSIGAGNVTVSGSGTGASPWRIEFVGALATQPYTLTADGSALTGGTTFTLSNTQTGLSDPWEIEFVGDLTSLHLPLSADGSALTGGSAIEVSEIQRGRTAGSVVKSDTTWRVRDFSTAGVPGMTATHIVRVAREEIQARGVSPLDHLTDDFTDTTDSAGVTLPEIVLPMALDADLHRLSVLLEEAGYQIEVSPALVLRCWQNRGADLSGTVDVTAWTQGVKNLEAGVARGEVKNVLRVRTDEGWHEVTDAASITARGRWEDGMTLEGFANAAEADLVTGPIVERTATAPRLTTLDLHSEAGIVPYEDFEMADLVRGSAFATTGFDEIPMRCVGITGRIEDTATIYRIELVD